MSNVFCRQCNNLLVEITGPTKCYFKCINCNIFYESNIHDSLRYDNSKDSNLAIYKTILKNAGKDPVNPKIIKKCISCSNDILKQVRLGEDMRLINTCIACDKQWIDS